MVTWSNPSVKRKTPYTKPKGYVDTKELQRRINRGGGSSVSRERQRIADEKAAAQAQAKAQAEAQRQKEIAKQEALAEKERQRILKERARLIARNARQTIKNSRDARTGDRLKITEWKKGSDTIRRVENLTKGITSYNQYGTGRGGGSVRQIGGVVVGGISKAENQQIKKDLINSGLTPITDTYGRVTGFRSPDTQKSYAYDGKGINTYEKDSGDSGAIFRRAIRENKMTGISRAETKLEEANRWFFNKTIEARTQIEKLEKQIEKFKKEGNKKEALKLAREKQNLKNSLIGYKTSRRILQTYGGLRAIPSIASQIWNNPKLIVPITASLFSGIKQDLGETVTLLKTSPGEGFAKIGTDYLTFAAVGRGLKITGKVTARGGRLLAPVFRATGKNIARLKIPLKNFVKSGSDIYIIKAVRKSKGGQLVKKVLKKAEKTRKIIKETQQAEISKFKSAQAYQRELAQARRIRRLASKKGNKRTITFGNKEYTQAVAAIEQKASDIAKNNANKILNQYKKSGGKLGLGKEEEFIKAVEAYYKKWLENNPKYKGLKTIAKYTEEYQLELFKKRRILSARKIANLISSRIEKLPGTNKIKQILSRIRNVRGRVTSKVKKGIKKGRVAREAEISKFKSRVASVKELKMARRIRRLARKKKRLKGKTKAIKTPKIAKRLGAKRQRIRLKQRKAIESFRVRESQLRLKKLEARRLKKIRKKIFKKSAKRKQIRSKVKIKFIKQKNVPSVTIEEIGLGRAGINKLAKDRAINNARRLTDKVFDEVAKRTRVDTTALKYRQVKNLVKKNIASAIRRGDRAKIDEFYKALKSIQQRVNSQSAQPTVTFVKKGSRTFRKVESLKPSAPKGKYIEIKKGNQVLLQEVKQETRQIQKQARLKRPKQIQRQVYVVESVQKQAISLRPLLRFASGSLFGSAVGSRVVAKSRQSFKGKTRQKLNFSPVTRQTTRTKQKKRSGTAVAVASSVNKKPKLLVETKQIIRRNRKNIKIGSPKQFKQKSLPKKVQTFYVVEKVRGKFKKLYPKPLTIKDARDYAVYSIDNRLSKTAFFVPLGKSRSVVRPPKQIQNYASRNARKVRPYKIRMGKKKQLVNGFIEKRKYFQDTPGEKRQLRAAQKRKFSPAQRKVMLRNLAKARAKRFGRSAPRKRVVAKKRKISPTQRRELLKRLKKARMVRMRNLKKRK